MDDNAPTIWDRSKTSAQNSQTLRIALPIAALILGIVSIAMSLLVIGLIFGLIGVILAVIALAGKSSQKHMASWALGLSVVGILASCFVMLIILNARARQSDTNSETSSANEWIQKAAPDFTTTDTKGNIVSLSELKGKRIVLTRWWPYNLKNRDAVPHFVKLRNSLPEDDTAIIAISAGKPEHVKGIARQLGINYSLIPAEGLPAPFNRVYDQVTFFIDRNGIIQSIFRGYHDFDKLMSLTSALDSNEPNNLQAEALTSESLP